MVRKFRGFCRGCLRRLYDNFWILIMGVTFAVVILFAADMVLYQGKFVAHHYVQQQAVCGGKCHGVWVPNHPAGRTNYFKRFERLPIVL